jgi:hypothetical protein
VKLRRFYIFFTTKRDPSVYGVLTHPDSSSGNALLTTKKAFFMPEYRILSKKIKPHPAQGVALDEGKMFLKLCSFLI